MEHTCFAVLLFVQFILQCHGNNKILYKTNWHITIYLFMYITTTDRRTKFVTFFDLLLSTFFSVPFVQKAKVL